MNNKHQLFDKKLHYKTIRNYKKNGMVGQSPEKRGPAERLPLLFLELLEPHIAMTQLERREETNPRYLVVIIRAALLKTKFAHFSVD